MKQVVISSLSLLLTSCWPHNERRVELIEKADSISSEIIEIDRKIDSIYSLPLIGAYAESKNPTIDSLSEELEVDSLAYTDLIK